MYAFNYAFSYAFNYAFNDSTCILLIIFLHINICPIDLPPEWPFSLMHMPILLGRCQLFHPLVTHLFISHRYMYISLILLAPYYKIYCIFVSPIVPPCSIVFFVHETMCLVHPLMLMILMQQSMLHIIFVLQHYL